MKDTFDDEDRLALVEYRINIACGPCLGFILYQRVGFQYLQVRFIQCFSTNGIAWIMMLLCIVTRKYLMNFTQKQKHSLRR
ncbi:MAG: hypothetical protein ACTTK1_07885 [Candidatus Cryptobacteroides sp.]